MPYKNIMLIDDDEDDHEIFTTAVSEVSSEVNCVGMYNAKEALGKLATDSIHPDIIFLDLNMPVMNGQQFLMEIKKNEALKDIPVIIYTTTSSPATTKMVKDLGAEGLITKPEHIDHLISILGPLLSE